MTQELVRYDAMCKAIAAAHKVDEVKDIRDKARAFEVYSRQAQNVEAERKACEIRLRAERRAGQLLKEMEKAKGGQPYQKSYQSDDPTSSPNGDNKTLDELGVSKQQSSDWQKLADVPEEEFELALSGEERPTTSGIINAFKEESKKPERPEEPEIVPNRLAIWIWGELLSWRREGYLGESPVELMAKMTPEMADDLKTLLPESIKWLQELERTLNEQEKTNGCAESVSSGADTHYEARSGYQDISAIHSQ
jgi:hypothetical protein